MSKKSSTMKFIALIFLEGDTEKEFADKLFPKYLDKTPRKVMNLHGNININNKIFDKVANFISNNADTLVRVYCFIDREHRTHNPPLDIAFIKSEFKAKSVFQGRVISTHRIVATQMIESWFFYDIEGIYKFLSVPHKNRDNSKYKPPEKFTANDLARLFSRYGKSYIKGKRCANLIEHLDTDKIYKQCTELRAGLDIIRGKKKTV